MSMRFTPTFRRVISFFTACSLVGVYVFSSLLVVRPVHAEGPSSLAAGAVEVATARCRGMSTSLTPDPCEGANEAANQVDDKLIKPAMQVALLTALLNLFTFTLDRLAYEAAIWVATGGEGETPLFNAKSAREAWADFGLDIAGDAIGELNDSVLTQLNIDFDICAPENPLFKLSMQLGLKQAYQPQEPKCDFQDIRSNWSSFIATTAETATNPSQTVFKAFAEGFTPGKNELSAVVGLNLKVHQRVLEAKTNQLFEQVNSGGFKAVTDVITGQVKTPSSVLQNEFQRQLASSNEEPTKMQMQAVIQNSDLLGNMFLQVAGVFTNTLLSTLMNRIYTGLFDVQPDVDPFDQELAGITSREDAANRFASLITIAPSQLENYNVLAEFVACPVGPIAIRGINNCVADSNFITAVARGGTSVPMTLQEAIDEGLVNGDWPLIPHEGSGIPQNQDPFCYTYGYCYGNLVKMRKARIIPVGFEIAASRNDPTNPATLQEIIDGFNDCGTQGGGLDDSHKWCHLIDPDWVLKYPETQCRALVNGELQISSLSSGRAGACVDTPSCVSESNDGSCDGGFSYCVQEKNVWRFRGDECPEQYASCLSLKNTFSGDANDYLFNTVDQSVCNADNAGCEWYRTNKYYDDAGTPDDASDDTFEWLPGDETYATADRESSVLRFDAPTGTTLAAAGYSYDTNGDGTADESYDTYSYQDRIYFNNNAKACSENAAGCSAVYQISDTLALNTVQNPSFENDEDMNGQPDSWSNASTIGTFDTSGSFMYYGSNAYSTSSTGTLYQSNVQIAPGNFYAFSFYARQPSSAGAETVTGRVVLTDAEGDYLNLAGTSVAGDCAVGDFGTGTSNSVAIEDAVPNGASYQRYECIFTVPDEGNGALAEIRLETGAAYVDAVQLELGEDASGFTEGYNSSSPSTSYLLVPPDYLGCAGEATDPAECDGYTQVCQAQDVGCNLYTPEDGDPSVPAIASSLDECPGECVGYTTYKQEATEREEWEFPLYFIAERASSCSSQYVGCDAFTNLDALSEGGEGSENYTYLRACMKPEMASGDASNNESATYFTWEGSDAAGYQLVTWTLLKSDDTDAPCAKWDVQAEDVLVCTEDASADYETADCDEHDDIFDNPDCREFYDTSGSIHYRDVTLTVAVDEECHPYRLDGSVMENCEMSGGYWTDAGDCRYFGLSDESVECPAAQAGCREYTGGAGRNATTVFSDDFEGGDLLDYGLSGGAVGYASVSNESVATGGHSVRVAPSGSSGDISTYWAYLNDSDSSTVYDESSSTTCTAYGWTVSDGGDCEIDEDGDGTVDCAVEDGDNGCGTLDDQLVLGKSYMLSFWAKGSADIGVSFRDEGGTGDQHDFVDPTTPSVMDELTIEGGWHSYDLGPLDTTDLASFGDETTLNFSVAAGESLYLDNIRLKAVEENITVIKDSWVVPSTCDQTPGGADSPQYYLGCEAYSDQDGNDVDLYQFSDLCSEDVVGCEAVFDTQNSDAALGMIYNARCQYVPSVTTDADTVSSNTPCELEGETVCTIAAGKSLCLFDYEGALPGELPYTAVSGGYQYMAIGPEAVVVDSDVPMYLVDNGTTTCTEENVGCEEIGLPTYNQEKSEVTEFNSAYYINDPDSYGDVLCANEELFCEEWSSTQDGNFYFKDPVDQTCEYKSGVTVDGLSLFGWFRSGTTVPCYWTDTNANGEFDPLDDEAYLIGGEELGIWRNGDDHYDGWVGTCQGSYDLCTEFRDTSDTTGTTYPAGTPYYFMDDGMLSEESLTASEQCQGQVSQREGCGVFYDTNDSELRYNATVSYVASTHADALFGDAPGSKQDPISCNNGGEDITTPDGDVINLCERRCYYETADGDEILTPSTMEVYPTSFHSVFSNPRAFLDASCYDDTDCPDMETTSGDTATGECVTAPDDLDLRASICADPPCDNPYALSNDANRVVKVYRDRECAAWLSCRSSQVSWNSSTSRYENICDRVGLCTRYTRSGDEGFCTEWTDTDAVVLDAGEYAGRNVTWNGTEYSGYAIPNQLPVEQYDQVNIAPSTSDSICATEGGTPEIQGGGFRLCDLSEEEADCTTAGYDHCTVFPQEFRLAYHAGPCDMGEVGWKGQCVVGSCENSGNSCSTNDDCSATTSEQCVVGYCQYVDSAVSSCTSDAQCVTSGYPVCDTTLAKCVNELAPNASGCLDDSECSAYSGGTCTPDAVSKTGSCYNNQCLTDIEGHPLADDAAREVECRGYPETTSPFTNKVVEASGGWVLPSGVTESVPSEQDSQPYAFIYGFQSVDVCAPIQGPDGNYMANDECLCSYSKATYGTQAETRYYPTDISESGVLTGVCIGGDNAGAECMSSDATSICGSLGTCAALSRQDIYLGWDGYCLEKDTSIQLNGSADEDDRACLSWFPVDQLTSSTDLYGKYLEAGYLPQDTFYCAEIQDTYNLKTQDAESGAACAESPSGGCDYGSYGESWDGFTSDLFLKDSCLASVWCPDGYFAVMTGCSDLAKTNGPTGGEECTTGGDDDCPFYCVPKGAYKTQQDTDLPGGLGSSLAGTPCFSPIQLEDDSKVLDSSFVLRLDNGGIFDDGIADSKEIRDLLLSDSERAYPDGISYTDYDAEGEAGKSLFDVYLVHDQLGDMTFNDLFEYYDDCETRGIVGESIDDFIFPFENMDQMLAMSERSESSLSFRGLQLEADSYAACTAVVQVSDDSADVNGNYNYAWTDRTWLSGGGYSIDDADARFKYETDTAQAVFGKAADVETFLNSVRDLSGIDGFSDLYPMPVTMCTDGTVGGVGGSCTATTDPVPESMTPQAMPYYDVLLGGEVGYTLLAGTDNEANCADTDGDYSTAVTTTSISTDAQCLCASPGEYSADCNVSITCADLDGDGSGDTCSGGSRDGEPCDDEDSHCYQFVCAADAARSYSSGGGGGGSATIGVDVDVCAEYDTSGAGTDVPFAEIESSSDAIDRMRQIFAYAMRVWVFRDGFYGYSGSDSLNDLMNAGNWAFAEDVTNDENWVQGFRSFDWLPTSDADVVLDDIRGENSQFESWLYDNSTDIGDPSSALTREAPSAPVVIAVGDCEGSHCLEDDWNAFSVDGQSSGVIMGSDGYENVTVSFYVMADKDQMPIRNMIVNWGNGENTSQTAWPLDSYSGSTADSNFYKNHRGYDEDDESMCVDEDWASSSSACESTYVTFTGSYVCSESDYNDLVDSGRYCLSPVTDENGNSRLPISPCAGGGSSGIGAEGSCVFQPRVYVKDNWGWCTGYCDAGSDDTTGCYGSECDPMSCPSKDLNGVAYNSCSDEYANPDKTVNPWVNFNGYIEVSP